MSKIGFYGVGWAGGLDLSEAPFQVTLGESTLAEGAEGIFDLSSLTKIICTSSLVAQDFLRSNLDWTAFLSQNLSPFIPELKGTAYDDLTLGEVWEHRSGFIAHKEFFTPPRRPAIDARESLWSMALQSILTEPRGPRDVTVYSDLGMMILGLYLERFHNERLDTLWESWKGAHGLKADSLKFGVSEGEAPRVLPTETRHPKGEVNDNKAFSMGSVAPHAGLLGSCRDVWSWLRAIETWSRSVRKLNIWLSPSGEGRYYGGWDRPSPPDSHAGVGFPTGVLGHLGFTGTALWWHPPSKRAGVLLTNRVFPEANDKNKAQVKALRQEFFSKLWQDKLEELCQPFQKIPAAGPI